MFSILRWTLLTSGAAVLPVSGTVRGEHPFLVLLSTPSRAGEQDGIGFNPLGWGGHFIHSYLLDNIPHPPQGVPWLHPLKC